MIEFVKLATLDAMQREGVFQEDGFVMAMRIALMDQTREAAPRLSVAKMGLNVNQGRVLASQPHGSVMEQMTVGITLMNSTVPYLFAKRESSFATIPSRVCLSCGNVMVKPTALTIQMKLTVLNRLHVTVMNFSVGMARVYLPSGVVMVRRTAKTRQTS